MTVRQENEALVKLDSYARKYDYTIGLRRRDWAWEFLRRNEKFAVEAYPHYRAVQRSISCIADSKVLSSPHFMGHFEAAFQGWVGACPGPDVAGHDCIA